MDVLKTKVFFGNVLSCALVINVKNAAEVRRKILAGDLQCAVIKPCLIIDEFQILAAANKALLSESVTKLSTKSLYTEILFNLSISKSISQSLLQFGINDDDTELLIVTFCDDTEISQMLMNITGDLVGMNTLSNWSDVSKIKKVYKINDSEASVSSTLNTIVSKISTKEFVSH